MFQGVVEEVLSRAYPRTSSVIKNDKKGVFESQMYVKRLKIPFDYLCKCSN